MAHLLSSPFKVLQYILDGLPGRHHRDFKMPSIPLEILLLILNELPKSSLLSFGRTSKWVWAVVEPLLYRSITFQFPKYRRHPPWNTPQLPPKHPIHSFFRAICQRPARAGYVKAATFTQPDPEFPVHIPTCFDYSAPPDVKPLWLEASATLERDGILEVWGLRNRVDAGYPYIFVEILLASLPKLETLVADLTLQGYATMGHLLMLKEVTIQNNLYSDLASGPYCTEQAPGLVCLPRLEHLSVVFTRLLDDDVAHANLPALRTLKLTDHLSYPSAIRKLLSKTPKLERLSYFLVEDTDELFGANDSDEVNRTTHQDEWSAFATSLDAIAGSLRILKISTDFTSTDRESEDLAENEWLLGVSARRGTVGSLRHLHNLTKLEIPLHVLVGCYPHRVKLREILPPGLEKLYLREDNTLWWYRYRCDFNLNGIIEDLRSYLLDPEPGNEVLSLQEVRIKPRCEYPPQCFREAWQEQELDEQHPLKRLENIARQAGVKCTMHVRVGKFNEKCITSAERENMDRIEELVLYDPGAGFPGDGATESTVESTHYPRRRRLKKSRCFSFGYIGGWC